MSGMVNEQRGNVRVSAGGTLKPLIHEPEFDVEAMSLFERWKHEKRSMVSECT